MIAVAAPCDYRPANVATHKIRKTGQPLCLELVETPDILATLTADKGGRWLVGFALETEDPRTRAFEKLQRKNCDLIVVDGPEAVDAAETKVEILDCDGHVAGSFAGGKSEVARDVFRVIQRRLIERA